MQDYLRKYHILWKRSMGTKRNKQRLNLWKWSSVGEVAECLGWNIQKMKKLEEEWGWKETDTRK